MVRRILILICMLATLLAAGGLGSWFYLERWAHTPGPPLASDVVVELKPATPRATLAVQLAQAKVINHALAFDFWVRLKGNYPKYQAGKYKFSGSPTPAAVADMMIKGEVWNEIILQVTVPEGWTSKNVIERLAANGVGHIVELRNLLTDRAFLDSLHVPGKSLEGYLYPATYSFLEMPTGMQALEQMVKTFWQKLPENYEAQVQARGLSLDQAVIFASLIELETRLDDERPMVSEVIWRRLADKAALGIDAAIIYGIPDYQGSLRSVHLTDVKNPYNTRLHVGLPPTAIGSPSTKSLLAVLNPTHLGNYYYVLIPGGIRHHFSKTLHEHNVHVKKLVEGTKRLKANPPALGAGPEHGAHKSEH